MCRRIILIIALLGLSSCASTTTMSSGSAPQFLLTYRASGGFTGNGVLLEITKTGQAYAWYVTEPRDPAGQGRLSEAELTDLFRLLAPLAGYERTYGHAVADGMVASITAEVDGRERTVTVYSSRDASPPEGWQELVATLQKILHDLREGV